MGRTRGGWCNTGLQGWALRLDALSTWLTQIAAYQQTICPAKEAAYLLRRLNGIEEPVLAKAK